MVEDMRWQFENFEF